MALRKQIIQLVYDKGIDTKTDMHLLPIGSLHRCFNIFRNKIGSLKKRSGSVKISKDTYPIIGDSDSFADYVSIKRLATNKNQLLSFGNVVHTAAWFNSPVDSVLLYDNNQQRHLEFKGAASIPVFNQTFQADVSSFPTSVYDIASDGTYALITLNTANAVNAVNYYIVQNIVTNKTVYFNRDLSRFDRAAFYESKLYRMFAKNSGISSLRLNPTDFSQGPEYQIVNDSDPTVCRFDHSQSSSNYYMAYYNNVGQVSIKAFANLDSTLPAAVYSITLAETATDAISICVNETANRVYVMFNVAAGTRLWIGDLTLTTVAATATISTSQSTRMSSARFSDNRTALFYTNTGGFGIFDIRTNTASVASGIITQTDNGEYLASKPIAVGESLYFNMYRDSPGQTAIMLRALTLTLPSTTYETQIVSMSLNGQADMPLLYSRCALFKTGNKLLSVYSKIVDDKGSGVVSKIPCILTGELDYSNAYDFGELADSTIWVGGLTQKFDGVKVWPIQPLAYPQIVSLTPSVGAGALTLTGTYSYIAIYEYIDAQGKITRSGASLPVSVTLAGAQNTVVAAYKALSSSGDIALYRTTNGGTVYYLETSASMSDALIVENQTLYTSSGELDNIFPPSSYAMTVWQDRVFLLTSEGIRYSKKVVGSRPVQFADELFLEIESEGGIPTAIVGLNDKLLIFKNGRIYYTTGDGPNETGQGGNFEPLKLISPNVGSISARCVQKGNEVTFQSASGYKIIDASFAIRDVLELDEFFNNLTPYTVKSIEHFEAKHELRITDSSATYVKDLVTQQWSMNPEWADNDAVVVDNKYWRLKPNYDILYDDGRSFGDDGTLITTSVTTGWITLGNVQGLQRVYSLIILARMINSAPLKVDIFYDYVPEIFASYTLSPTNKNFAQFSNAQIYLNDGYAPNPDTYPYQFEIHLPKQKCEAIRFTISDIPASAQDTLELVALGLEVGFKKGTFTGRDAVKA